MAACAQVPNQTSSNVRMCRNNPLQHLQTARPAAQVRMKGRVEVSGYRTQAVELLAPDLQSVGGRGRERRARIQRGAEERPVVEHRADRKLYQLGIAAAHPVRPVVLHQARVVDEAQGDQHVECLGAQAPARCAPAERRLPGPRLEHRSRPSEELELLRAAQALHVLVQHAVEGDLVVRLDDRIDERRAVLGDPGGQEESRGNLVAPVEFDDSR